MKEVILIHGWGGSSKGDFFPWLKKELEKRDFKVTALDMPNTETPKIEEWIPYLENNIGDLDENTSFIGHSIGCQAVLRFLEKENKAIAKTMLIAPWMHLDKATMEEEGEESVKIAKPWMETPIDFKKIKKLSRFLCVLSDNDPYVPLSNAELFKKELDSEIIIEKKCGHFNDKKYVSLLNSFIKFTQK